MKRPLFFFASLFAFAGCQSLGHIEKSQSIKPDESIFVFGASPEQYFYNVIPVELKPKGYRTVRIAALYGRPEGGYLVGKGVAGEHLALSTVKATKDKESIAGPRYTPCGGKRGLVFRAEPGKVLYITHATYSFEGNLLVPRFHDDFESARRYIDENFPNLRGKLERGPYELIPALAECVITVPITIPGR